MPGFEAGPEFAVLTALQAWTALQALREPSKRQQRAVVRRGGQTTTRAATSEPADQPTSIEKIVRL